MNKSEILKALEWVDQTARDGDALRLAQAKQALEMELSARKNTTTPEAAFKVAFESFVRKHGREPFEDIAQD